MGVRERFEHELDAVQKEFLKLCDQSIERLETSFKALINKDLEVAQEIVQRDVEINRFEEAINDRVILLMTRQQPVATDLR
ncbi:phosphate transport system regulatory protein PhoU, partial [Butyricicoccus sp. 1XD8-22]